MDQDSALVLNAGVHLLKSTSFRNYQKIIKGFVRLLRDNYRGKVVWKTSPSLGKQTELYTGCSRRFHTEQVMKTGKTSYNEGSMGKRANKNMERKPCNRCWARENLQPAQKAPENMPPGPKAGKHATALVPPAREIVQPEPSGGNEHWVRGKIPFFFYFLYLAHKF